MYQTIESVGFFCALAALLSVGGLLAKHLLLFYWDESRQGKVVDAVDMLMSLGDVLKRAYQYMLQEAVGVFCAAVAFFVLARTPALSFFAAVGYSAVVFLVAGIAAPWAIRKVSPQKQTAEQKSPGQQ